MGCGSWTETSYKSYATSTGKTYDSIRMCCTDSVSASQMFKQDRIHKALDIKGKIRECCDNDEHPNTVPVILALDVTGSMGNAAVTVAQSLSRIMTDIMTKAKDVEFSIMAIGDIEYDDAPVQMSQFESDVRIAEAIDNIYFEHGGGGNFYESYTLAWYTGLRHAKLDCWNRGKKGIIITLGDEPLNPVLRREGWKTTLNECLGDNLQDDIGTSDLYKEVIQKYDVYHISVNEKECCYSRNNIDNSVDKSFKNIIGADHYFVASLNQLPGTISKIIIDRANSSDTYVDIDTSTNDVPAFEGGEISWGNDA